MQPAVHTTARKRLSSLPTMGSFVYSLIPHLLIECPSVPGTVPGRGALASGLLEVRPGVNLPRPSPQQGSSEPPGPGQCHAHLL